MAFIKPPNVADFEIASDCDTDEQPNVLAECGREVSVSTFFLRSLVLLLYVSYGLASVEAYFLRMLIPNY